MSAIPPKQYGSIAVGSKNRFDVEVDEAFDDPDDVQMTLTAPGWSFRFNLIDHSGVRKLRSFLQEHVGRLVFSELVVGSLHGTPVLIIKDDECADRFWIRAYGAGQLVEFTLTAEHHLNDLTDAVSQAAECLAAGSE